MIMLWKIDFAEKDSVPDNISGWTDQGSNTEHRNKTTYQEKQHVKQDESLEPEEVEAFAVE